VGPTPNKRTLLNRSKKKKNSHTATIKNLITNTGNEKTTTKAKKKKKKLPNLRNKRETRQGLGWGEGKPTWETEGRLGRTFGGNRVYAG